MNEAKRTRNEKLHVRDVRFWPATPEDAERGLTGFVSLVLNRSIKVDGVALRRTREGRWTLSFPSRLDTSGRRHFHVHPLNDEARREVEAQVFRALGLEKARNDPPDTRCSWNASVRSHPTSPIT